MISFIDALFALLFRGAFLLLMLLIFLLICFNSLSFRIFLTAFLPCLFLKNLACVLVGSGYLHTLNLVPCWFVLVGSGYLHALNLVSLVRVLGWCVLVPCWFVCPGSCPGWCGYLHALNLVSLVRALLVRVLVGVVTCMP